MRCEAVPWARTEDRLFSVLGAHDSRLAVFIAEAPIPRTSIFRFVSAFAQQLPESSRVLDAGAGTAPYRELFSHCDYVTHDWSETVHRQSAPAVVGDLHERLPLAAESFDAVLCTEVLEHVRDAELVLKELHRLLRPGGKLAVTVPFVGPLHEEPHDHRRFTNHGLTASCAAAGFTEVHVEPLSGWFSMLAQVFREQGLATQPPGNRQSVVQRLVAALFRGLSRALAGMAPTLDAKLDKRRALPIGWTAVAVA